MDERPLKEVKTMQLATVHGDQPWICTVYFVLVDGSFYWLSFPERRHSRELEQNARVAIAVAIKTDVPVTGLQAEGEAQAVKDLEEVRRVMVAYVQKYGQGADFAERFATGKNRHILYKMTPQKVMLFDENGSPDEPYKEVSLLS